MGVIKKGPLLPWAPPAPDTARFKRAQTNYNFYNSTHWRAVSKQTRNANPVCEVSKNTDHPFPSEVTDHIIPINQGGSPFDSRNHIAMSHHWHNIKSAKERHTPILVKAVANEVDELIPANRQDIIDLLINSTL